MFKRIKDAIDGMYERLMPGFWLRMRARYQWAFGILIAATLWIASSLIFHPNTEASVEKEDATVT